MVRLRNKEPCEECECDTMDVQAATSGSNFPLDESGKNLIRDQLTDNGLSSATEIIIV